MAIFGGNYATTRKYTRDSVAEPDFEAVGIYDDLYPGYIWLYIFNGMLDAAYQTWIYFTMGAQSNDPRKLAYFVGWYKGFQSAGSAISFRVDANKTCKFPILGGVRTLKLLKQLS